MDSVVRVSVMDFIILGEPVAKGRPKISSFGGHARAYTPKKTRDAEANIRSQIVQQLPNGFIPFKDALSISIEVYRSKPKSKPKRVTHPTTKPDLDNYLKTILDAMNTVVFEDDSQIISINAKKEYGIPKIKIEIKEVIAVGSVAPVSPTQPLTATSPSVPSG
jgi:Holliday junction resolvase RusA-like endonuclease